MLTDRDKEYEAVMQLGISTDTQDLSGEVLKECPVTVTEEEARNAILSFIGDYDQIPPMYSALKVNGKSFTNWREPVRKWSVSPERLPLRYNHFGHEAAGGDLPGILLQGYLYPDTLL